LIDYIGFTQDIIYHIFRQKLDLKAQQWLLHSSHGGNLLSHSTFQVTIDDFSMQSCYIVFSFGHKPSGSLFLWFLGKRGFGKPELAIM
jgi:hypothetical protein